MARPLKDNADWYAHQAQMRNNRKVRVLRARFGAEGYATWCMLLECLTESDRFVLGWTDLDRELLAGDFGLSVERLQEIVTCCEKIGMLSIESDTVFSKNHQEGMKPLLEVRERKRQWKQAKKPKSDGESRVSDGENPQSTDTGRDTGTGRVHNTLSGIEKEKEREAAPSAADFENPFSETTTLPSQTVRTWAITNRAEISRMLDSSGWKGKRDGGDVFGYIQDFAAHYFTNEAWQKDPVLFFREKFESWMREAERRRLQKETAPATRSTKPKPDKEEPPLTLDQVVIALEAHPPFMHEFSEKERYGLRFCKNIPDLREKIQQRVKQKAFSNPTTQQARTGSTSIANITANAFQVPVPP